MMSRARGFHFEHGFDKEIQRIEKAAVAVKAHRRQVLTAMGVQSASWAVQDFRDKSEGKAAQGIQWRPITRAAARTRLAARAPYKRQTQELLDLRQREAAVKAGPRGNKAKEYAKISRRRQAIRAKRRADIDKEHAAAKTGVDTGRLVNSIVFGVEELKKVRPPRMKAGAKPPPRARWELSEFSLRLGSHLDYAEYFDAMRPIFPDQWDQSRKVELQEIAQKTIQIVIDKELGGKR